MKTQRCDQCLFFVRHDDAGGRCHRFPPQPSGLASPLDLFPIVNNAEWCGEFSLQPPAVSDQRSAKAKKSGKAKAE